MLMLERRLAPAPILSALAPVLAVLATMIAGGILFAMLGKDPVAAIRIIFLDPLINPFARSELLVKAAPLALIATGLAIGFRAGVWNIGAEGQFVIGAILGGATGLAFHGVAGIWLLPLMTFMGALGGFLWAMIPAILRIRFNANEILVSLMLVYVAILLLSALVAGPLRNPQGMGFPGSRSFHDSATLPVLISGTRVHVGILIAIATTIAAHALLQRHRLGFNIRLLGQAPRAASFAGANQAGLIAVCLGISGALAGMAGLFEVAGPVGQLVDGIPAGYGFTAIIVAFLGRLNPVGILLASLIMALTYIGGEGAQLELQLPKSAMLAFQGMLLFFLLAVDVIGTYRLRWTGRGRV